MLQLAIGPITLFELLLILPFGALLLVSARSTYVLENERLNVLPRVGVLFADIRIPNPDISRGESLDGSEVEEATVVEPTAKELATQAVLTDLNTPKKLPQEQLAGGSNDLLDGEAKQAKNRA